MVLRKLWSWEWEKLRLHLLRLETADRRLRFCRLVRDDFIHDYCDEIDRMQTTVVGCFVDDVLRGAAELVRLAGTVPVSAEIALSVEQTRGIRRIGYRRRGETRRLRLTKNHGQTRCWNFPGAGESI